MGKQLDSLNELSSLNEKFLESEVDTMKFLIFIAVATLSVATNKHRRCPTICTNELDPHCGCTSLPFGNCREFANKCRFDVTNCTSRGAYVVVAAAECNKINPIYPPRVPFKTECVHICKSTISEPYCACKSKPTNKICHEFGSKCAFEMYNCTTKDYGLLTRGKCPRQGIRPGIVLGLKN